MNEAGEEATQLQHLEKVRPLMNEILERFNQEQVEPEEAGLIILALTHRLLGVLAPAPEPRRRFLAALINMINADLAAEEIPGEDLGGMF